MTLNLNNSEADALTRRRSLNGLHVARPEGEQSAATPHQIRLSLPSPQLRRQMSSGTPGGRGGREIRGRDMQA